MAKYNIKFNNTDYQIDESALADATAALRTHLSTTMNGTGATIELGGTSYSVDSTKLSTATNNFVSHLGTIAGNGHKVVVGGVEYGVDSTKVSGAVSELEGAWGGLNNPDSPTLEEERLEGDGAEYYTLAPTALSFRSTAPLNELQEVQINGVTVDSANYTLEEGSTIVTFPIDYLKTLNVGSYEVAVASDSKTVKGSFTVAAPELNEYGFYYNQPYSEYVYFEELGGSALVAIIIRDDDTLELSIPVADYYEQCQYTCIDNLLSSTSEAFGYVELSIVSCNEMKFGSLSFILNERIVADKDYLYLYNSIYSGYEVRMINKTMATYESIRTGINGIDTVLIPVDAFKNSNMVIAPEIPDTVTTINDTAFAFCTALKSIELPAGVVIKSAVFNGCTSLESIVIPEGVSSIGVATFQNCTSLTSVTIPSSVTSIFENSFAYCTSLVSVRIPDGVTFVGSGAFRGCTSLEHIVFEGTVEQWNAITFEEYDGSEAWNRSVPATYVQCSDGQVAL